jgi:hypothetical protein
MTRHPPSFTCIFIALAAWWPLAAHANSFPRDERFGVMTHFAHGWEPELAAAVARSGAGTVRDELYWRDVEPQKGVFVFSEQYQKTMAALGRQGLEPLVVLSFENHLYDGGATPYSDEGIAGYARYGVEVLRRFGTQIKAVEIWNEYNGAFVRGPAADDRAATYLRMLRKVHQEVKRDRPDVRVVGGATAGVPLPYWEKLLAGGALEFMDVLSVHPYRYDAGPEGLETDIAELRELMTKFNRGPPKPIWVTEIGWKTRPAHSPADLVIDDLVQARFLLRAYALLLSAGVERVYWYLFRDYNQDLMGLVRDDPLATPKPAYAAMVAMTQQLRGAVFIQRDRTPSDLYSIGFRRPSGDQVRVMWSLQPRTVTASGVTGVTDMFGLALGSSGTLQLSESPIYVVGEVQGLPEPASVMIAESQRGFGGNQGENGWSYGFTTAASGAFTPLAKYGADDWSSAWHGDLPYLTVTAKEQHPSTYDGAPVSAVRRWQSDRSAMVRVAGSFLGGKQGGDGVGVAVAVDGQCRFRKLLGGGPGAPVVENFELIEKVQPGTTIDFTVDPGPAANIDHDGAAVSVTISTLEP